MVKIKFNATSLSENIDYFKQFLKEALKKHHPHDLIKDKNQFSVSTWKL